MIAKIYSAIPYGYEGRLIEVEGDLSNGLPSFNIVGMANKTISESRERVRSAITNSGFSFPSKKATINLAPAELMKDGSHLDIPIALAILVLSKQLQPEHLQNTLFVGELSLDGLAKPVRGIINIVETAKNAGFQKVYLPLENAVQAQLIDGIEIIGIRNFRELFLRLIGEYIEAQSIVETSNDSTPYYVKNTETGVRETALLENSNEPTLDDIKGQTLAKRALIVALAGRHNLLLSGPPGSGKTLLAHTAANLLPPPSAAEKLEITKIHALASTAGQSYAERPFRAPHHTASLAAMIGGANQTIGEISLAHRGVLFLDELPEFPRHVLEALRQPLEDKKVTVIRAKQRLTYPADFMLIATMNPCPCGYLGSTQHACKCSTAQIEHYQRKISGPILDRIDLIINVEPVEIDNLATKTSQKSIVKNTETEVKTTSNDSLVVNSSESCEQSIVKNTITEAIRIQNQRYRSAECFNGSLSSHEVNQYIHIDSDAKMLLLQAAKKLKLSARSYFKVIKVAQTIADLAHSTEVKTEHISEALAMRSQLH